jgi:hypothetical protein
MVSRAEGPAAKRGIEAFQSGRHLSGRDFPHQERRILGAHAAYRSETQGRLAPQLAQRRVVGQQLRRAGGGVFETHQPEPFAHARVETDAQAL